MITIMVFIITKIIIIMIMIINQSGKYGLFAKILKLNLCYLPSNFHKTLDLSLLLLLGNLAIVFWHQSFLEAVLFQEDVAFLKKKKANFKSQNYDVITLIFEQGFKTFLTTK